MSLGIGFFFGFDNTPSQLMNDIFGQPAGGGPLPPPATPPVQPYSPAIIGAQQALRRQELNRHTLQSTIHAGLGGWQQTQGPAIGAWPAITGGKRG